MTKRQLTDWGLNPKFITEEFLASVWCTETLPSRFVEKVQKTDTCWLWQGACDIIKGKKRYGMLSRCIDPVNGRQMMIRAHIVSWLLHYGPITPLLFVCHACDIMLCVRPDHLWLGTRIDNIHDAMRKGRLKNQTYGGQRKGEGTPTSKLTNEQVKEIVHLLESENQVSIAERFAVTQGTISDIKTGKTWTHISGIPRH